MVAAGVTTAWVSNVTALELPSRICTPTPAAYPAPAGATTPTWLSGDAVCMVILVTAVPGGHDSWIWNGVLPEVAPTPVKAVFSTLGSVTSIGLVTIVQLGVVKVTELPRTNVSGTSVFPDESSHRQSPSLPAANTLPEAIEPVLISSRPEVTLNVVWSMDVLLSGYAVR